MGFPHISMEVVDMSQPTNNEELRLEIKKYKHVLTGEIVESIHWSNKAQGPIIAKWCDGNIRKVGRFKDILMTVMTNGDVRVLNIDDYVFKDSCGDFYPSEEEVFEKRYQKLSGKK